MCRSEKKQCTGTTAIANKVIRKSTDLSEMQGPVQEKITLRNRTTSQMFRWKTNQKVVCGDFKRYDSHKENLYTKFSRQ